MLPDLTLSLQFSSVTKAEKHRAALPRHMVKKWIRHTLQTDAEITVRIVDAEEGQTLNRDYRKKDYATNVLTFDYTQEPLV
ncbi:MAG: rRNA maturation RNase YbeY, partial [Rhodoferax sp.]|nr:rRNA maturation RNase YbeY [Rhodoferax sp.]